MSTSGCKLQIDYAGVQGTRNAEPIVDYISCILTIVSTVLIGKKLWQGWVIAGANSIIICVIGMRSAQFGLVPANLFCIGLYANNLRNWRQKTHA